MNDGSGEAGIQQQTIDARISELMKLKKSQLDRTFFELTGEYKDATKAALAQLIADIEIEELRAQTSSAAMTLNNSQGPTQEGSEHEDESNASSDEKAGQELTGLTLAANPKAAAPRALECHSPDSMQPETEYGDDEGENGEEEDAVPSSDEELDGKSISDQESVTELPEGRIVARAVQSGGKIISIEGVTPYWACAATKGLADAAHSRASSSAPSSPSKQGTLDEEVSGASASGFVRSKDTPALEPLTLVKGIEMQSVNLQVVQPTANSDGDVGQFFLEVPAGETLKKVHWMLASYADDANMQGVIEGLVKLASQGGVLFDVYRHTALIYKPGFQNIRSDLMQPISIMRLKLPMGAGAPKVKEIIYNMLLERLKHTDTRCATWALKADTKAPWTAEKLYEAVRDMTHDEFDKLTLDAKLKKAHQRSELENALMMKGVLAGVKKLRNNAAERMKMAGAIKYLDDEELWASHARFPKDCQNLDQKVCLPDGSEITLEDFILKRYHLEFALLLLGDRGLGKSPFVRAVARYWTIGYLGEHPDGTTVPLSELYFAYCGTVAALNKVTAHGLMKTKVPVVVDDSDVQDPGMNRTGGSGDFQGLRANYLKHMLNVQDGGEMGARFNQTAFRQKQPRTFVSNDDSVEDWLPKGFTDNHKAAIMKRLAICKLAADKPLIRETARAVHSNTNDAEAAAMVQRAMRLDA